MCTFDNRGYPTDLSMRCTAIRHRLSTWTLRAFTHVIIVLTVVAMFPVQLYIGYPDIGRVYRHVQTLVAEGA
jgi:membrane-bound metal-dependent hydrolase YbcI (DUF457 family)